MGNAMLTASPIGHLPIMMRLAMDRVTYGMQSIWALIALKASTQGRGTVVTKNVWITLQIKQHLIQHLVVSKKTTTNFTQPAVLAIKNLQIIQYVYLLA
jgi:hypothetical protein